MYISTHQLFVCDEVLQKRKLLYWMEHERGHVVTDLVLKQQIL